MKAGKSLSTAETVGQEVVIRVRDNGIGIASGIAAQGL